jgi:hypothetical protein
MLIPLRCRPLIVASTAAAAMSTAAAAQGQTRENCSVAGTSVEIVATVSGTVRQSASYVVINHRRERLRWIRIGVGGTRSTEFVPQQKPLIVNTPAGWRGQVVYPEQTNHFYLLWEATSDQFSLAPSSRGSFGIEAAGPDAIPRGQLGADRQPIRPVHFITLPFTAGGESGACWWGWTSSGKPLLPVGGYLAGVRGVSVRRFSGASRDYVMVDYPRVDTMIRLANKPLYLSIPLALRWGVKGGFSHEASIGIGLAWSPIQYVGIYGRTQFGTFIFNNRTHTREVGIDINIPRHPTNSVGAVEQGGYFVLGVEYFQRSAVKWAGFLEGPQWYASGRGIAIKFGIRRAAWDP